MATTGSQKSQLVASNRVLFNFAKEQSVDRDDGDDDDDGAVDGDKVGLHSSNIFSSSTYECTFVSEATKAVFPDRTTSLPKRSLPAGSSILATSFQTLFVHLKT